jgi:pyrroline-5-carboxylate reductase
MQGDTPVRLGFLGVGTINVAVIKGLCKFGEPLGTLTISPRNAERAAALAAAYPGVVVVAESNQAVLDASDWVLIGTPPGPVATETALEGLIWRKEQTAVSLISGVSPEQLASLCAPAGAVVQVIPLPPAEMHQSTTLICPKHAGLEALFRKVGKVIAVDDRAAMCKLMAISCTMGSFYCRLQACQEWLVANRENVMGVQGAHLNPLGLFLRTSIPFTWRILSACRPF